MSSGCSWGENVFSEGFCQKMLLRSLRRPLKASRLDCSKALNFPLAKKDFAPSMAALLSGRPLVLRDDSPLSASGAEALTRFTHPTLPTRKQQ